MDERRDPPPDGQDRAPLVAAGSRLPTVQEAYAGYTEHFLACGDCRDPDRSCEVARELWRTYMDVGSQAARQVG
ncbi:hypothetical protein ABT215_12765 [Streptomyces sp900105755]|uniref:hypothetical protein n=1 Tax=Streptomyces sp. 900105755 TaxID=3154389 RepID=UPI00331C4CD8